MEEGRGGCILCRYSFASTSSSSLLGKAIRISRFIPEGRKHQLLHGTSLDQTSKQSHAMTRLIHKHRTRQLEKDEGKGHFLLHANMKVVTGLMYGRLIFQSFSKMLSEYCREIYKVELEDVEVLKSYEGSVAPGQTQSAKWFHLNFKAKTKADDVVHYEEVFFAEVLVLMFRYTPPLCCVNACLPVDKDGNFCHCLFTDCDLKHPSKAYYQDGKLLGPVVPTLLGLAKGKFQQLAVNESRKTKGFVWLAADKSSQVSLKLQITRMAIPALQRDKIALSMEKGRRRGGTGDVEVDVKYLVPSRRPAFKMSKDILVPKKFGLIKGKIRNTKPARLQKRADDMARLVENCRKPRAGNLELSPRIRQILKVLPECYKKKYGLDLEGVDGLVLSEDRCPFDKITQRAAYLHMNFSAKIKNENGVSEEQLYFAEVIQIHHIYFGEMEYYMTVCTLVGKNHTAGRSSKCGICRRYLQISHPSPEEADYIDHISKSDLSRFNIIGRREEQSVFEKEYCFVITPFGIRMDGTPMNDSGSSETKSRSLTGLS